MIYPQHNKNKNRFFALAPQAVLLAAISIFFLFSGGVLKSWSFKIIDFFAPERKELEVSRAELAMLTRIKDLEAKNHLDVGRLSGSSAYTLKTSFGGGYLFLDTFFLRGGGGLVKAGDWVVKDDIFLGKIVEVGEDFAKFKSLGSLRERSVLRAGENKDIVFEAEGIGGGELKAELPVSLVIKAGDPIWWGEDPRYLAGFIEEVRVRETSPIAEIIIIVPLKIERLSEVEVLLR